MTLKLAREQEKMWSHSGSHQNRKITSMIVVELKQYFLQCVGTVQSQTYIHTYIHSNVRTYHI